MQERTDMRKVLLDHQHESKMTYLETLQTLVEAQKELKVQQSRLKEAAAALAAIKEVKEQARAEFRHKLSGDLAEAVLLDPQPFKNPLRRAPLRRRRRLIAPENRVDYRNQWPELRPLWSLGPHIAEYRHISSRLSPKTRAASRLLFPSTNTNRPTTGPWPDRLHIHFERHRRP